MENPHLEVAVSSSKDIICQKRQAPTTLQEDTQPCKQVRKGSPVYSMEWEASSLPDEEVVASSLALPTAKHQPTHRCHKLPRWARYNPDDFTSDEMATHRQGLRESPPAMHDNVYLINLLQSILGQFPMGLRVAKLEALMWKKHKVQLWKLILQQGYWDVLKFLQEVPGIQLHASKWGSQCLVQLEQANGKTSH